MRENPRSANTKLCFAHQPERPAKSQQNKTKVRHANNPSKPLTLTPMKSNVHLLCERSQRAALRAGGPAARDVHLATSNGLRRRQR